MSRKLKQLDGEDKGLVHLKGLNAHDHQTFCGHSWETVRGYYSSLVRYEETTEAISCPWCINAIREAREVLRGVRIPS